MTESTVERIAQILDKHLGDYAEVVSVFEKDRNEAASVIADEIARLTVERDHNWAEYLAERAARMEANSREAKLTAERDATRAEVERLRDLLRESLPLVAEREFLDKHTYYFGPEWGEPSPAEWGIAVDYRQTADAGPKAQFDRDVDEFHHDNADEHDPDGPDYRTLANKIQAAQS